MPQRISFQDEIAKNNIKSFILIIVIFLFFLVLGYIISQVFDPSYFFVIMAISIIFSLMYVLISYYNSDKIALASVRAKPASRTEHKELYDAAENMSIASGLPTPRLYVMESDQINAFASGRNPKNSVLCFTTGALKKLNKNELEGVVAHEMSHIANYDIKFMTLVAVMIGMVSIIAEIFLRSLWFSGNDRDNKAQVFLILIGILFAILAPIATQLVSLAISRRREYHADATGVKFTRYPKGLADALRKIKNEHVSERERRHTASKAVAPLFISDPFRRKVQNLLSTHPPLEARIQKLDAM